MMRVMLTIGYCYGDYGDCNDYDIDGDGDYGCNDDVLLIMMRMMIVMMLMVMMSLMMMMQLMMVTTTTAIVILMCVFTTGCIGRLCA